MYSSSSETDEDFSISTLNFPENFGAILDDLTSRFILNGLPEELKEIERIMFHVEEAHWYYEDFFREKSPQELPHLSFPKFVKALVEMNPLLEDLIPNPSEACKAFSKYKKRVPVFGGIILDESATSTLLVRNWDSNLWTFPKGKINKGEDPFDCAIREVFEESGFDMKPWARTDHYLDTKIGAQTRLFIASGVPKHVTSNCSPQCRKEIAEVGWHSLNEVFRVADEPSLDSTITYSSLVRTMIKPLLQWINKYFESDTSSVQSMSSLEANGEQMKKKKKKKKKNLNALPANCSQNQLSNCSVAPSSAPNSVSKSVSQPIDLPSLFGSSTLSQLKAASTLQSTSRIAHPFSPSTEDDAVSLFSKETSDSSSRQRPLWANVSAFPVFKLDYDAILKDLW